MQHSTRRTLALAALLLAVALAIVLVVVRGSRTASTGPTPTRSAVSPTVASPTYSPTDAYGSPEPGLAKGDVLTAGGGTSVGPAGLPLAYPRSQAGAVSAATNYLTWMNSLRVADKADAVKGSLKGVFDGETVEVDWNRPGVVIDISRIRASDAGVALTMTCGQALVDQILTFSDHQWVRILDECWRQIRYPHIVRRISEGQKLARGDDVTAGSATLISLHRISDLMGAASEVRELALGLLADCSTRIIYNQADDQVPITRSTLNLTDVEGELLPRLPQATALWKVNQRSFLVDHTVLRDGYEWDLIQTDSRMGVRKYETVQDPDAAMADELGQAGIEPTEGAA